MSDQLVSTDPNYGLTTAPLPPSTGPGIQADTFHGPWWNPVTVPRGPSAERDRSDNSLLGMPPELVAASGVGVGRAVGAQGLSFTQRALAGLKATASTAAPAIKYEIVKDVLEHFGVSKEIAIPAAIAFSGFRRGANGAANGAQAAETEAAAATRTPAAKPLNLGRSAPAAAATPVETPPAVTARPAPAPAAPAATVPPKMGRALKILIEEGGLTPTEANRALGWLKEGQSLETIQARIQADRAVRASSSFEQLPSAEEVARAVKDRNDSGHWK